MVNALEPLFPALRSLEALGLPAASLSGWFAYANAQQAQRLAGHFQHELALLAQEGAAQVDHAYLRSDAFRANVVQAVRAAEVADSDGKLRLIARALAGCLLTFPAPQVDKFQTMRVLEGLSEREFGMLLAVVGALDPLDPYADILPAGARLPGWSRDEAGAALLGLGQQGLLMGVNGGEAWRLSPLARQLVTLARLNAPWLAGNSDGLDLF
ncbi:hypothetical protein D3875_13220 [Deinococcus cavernae]|uniref:Uncharacterized protein n=1 Tax=Deinococcus cavernae TaxID=2320857 RepID=A0A418V8H5_9DEIO|nr:hypothetical protein [Deinococcus cavernae]RJF72366.1 hypothetical protein D3875_13220 [Deinococcus cavernae]